MRRNEVRQSFETFTNEFNLRLSQELDSMMSMVHNQINRAISTAISERVIPEIQNIVSSMSSSGNRDTEASLSSSSQENRANSSGLKTKILKKDSRSVGDLRDTAGRGSYKHLASSLRHLYRNDLSLGEAVKKEFEEQSFQDTLEQKGGRYGKNVQ